MRYHQQYSKKVTPQSQPIPGSSQVPNSAGGFAWAVDDWVRMRRFLILGNEGGSYYASEQKLTAENAQSVMRCLQEDGSRAVEEITTISVEGRAPKNDPAIFALSLACSVKDTETKKLAFEALPKVCRTGTHLFQFLDAMQSQRGWGRAARTAVGKWYLDKDPEKLAYQLIKYRQREGWTHRDALRLSHPKTTDEVMNSLLRWAVKEELNGNLPPLVGGFVKMQGAKTPKECISILSEYPGLSWEMIPTELLGSPEVWGALLPNLPMTALIRNLGRMTANSLIAPMSNAVSIIIEKLAREESIKKARIHPIAVLAALTTYSSGQGARGQLTWSPVPQVVDALDKAFYLSFGNVEPTNKRWLLALDVSGSMSNGTIAGVPGLTPRVGSAAMAMVTARTEPQWACMAFSHELIPLEISPRERLDDIVEKTSRLVFGGTDCALPMIWALEKKVPVDIFVVYTDSETWAGDIHPTQALQEYRNKMGVPSKLIVVGMVSNEFSIADPDDAGMLDCCGFDLAVPQVMADFATQA